MSAVWLALAMAAGRAAPPPAAAAASRGSPEAPVHVACDDMVVQNRQQTARCEGHVRATRQTMLLTCDRSVAHYDQAGTILDFTCLGSVKLVDQGRTASADQAVYREAARTVELTGHATVKRGEDVLNGEPILFYVDEDRVVAKDAKLRGRAGDLPAGGPRLHDPPAGDGAPPTQPALPLVPPVPSAGERDAAPPATTRPLSPERAGVRGLHGGDAGLISDVPTHLLAPVGEGDALPPAPTHPLSPERAGVRGPHDNPSPNAPPHG